jgi:hypothetical protein
VRPAREEKIEATARYAALCALRGLPVRIVCATPDDASQVMQRIRAMFAKEATDAPQEG